MTLDQLCHDIVQSTVLDPKDEEICRKMVGRLSDVDREYIAQSSYSYWNACRTGEITDREAKRDGMALREAARYYDATEGDHEMTVEALKNTSKFRQTYRIDLIRTCFEDAATIKHPKDAPLLKKYRELISTELSVQPMFIKAGAAGRSVLVLGVRSCKETKEEAFLITVIYMMERACAATEVMSRGKDQMMDVVFNIGGFNLKCAPSRNTFKNVSHVLQSHYCQRLNTLVILDPPLWLAALYKVVSVFVDQRTRNKIQMARGGKKKSKLGEILKGSQDDMDGVDAVKVASTLSFDETVDDLSCRPPSEAVGEGSLPRQITMDTSSCHSVSSSVLGETVDDERVVSSQTSAVPALGETLDDDPVMSSQTSAVSALGEIVDDEPVTSSQTSAAPALGEIVDDERVMSSQTSAAPVLGEIVDNEQVMQTSAAPIAPSTPGSSREVDAADAGQVAVTTPTQSIVDPNSSNSLPSVMETKDAVCPVADDQIPSIKRNDSDEFSA